VLTELNRRTFLALGVAAVSGLGSRRASADDAPKLAEYTSIPDKLKGAGDLRIAGYGGTAQDAQRKACYEPYGRLSGVNVKDFAGADINKVKAMVETGNVEWDVVQLSRGTVRNLMKKGDYFEKIDYDLVDTDHIDPVYRFDYALDMLVWAEVMAYRTDAFKGAIPVGWADFWDTRKFFRRPSAGWCRPELAGTRICIDGRGRATRQGLSDRYRHSVRQLRQGQRQRGEVVGDRRDPAADADRQGNGADLGVEWPHGGDPGRRCGRAARGLGQAAAREPAA
jgi:spermidine/putrescine-binding protein